MRKTAKERIAEREERARSELLDGLFEPWVGAADNAAAVARLGPLDPRDTPALTHAIKTDILPGFSEATLETQGRIRTALTVLMRGDGEEFRNYWLDLRAPFGASPADADAIFAALAPLLGVRLPDSWKGGRRAL